MAIGSVLEKIVRYRHFGNLVQFRLQEYRFVYYTKMVKYQAARNEAITVKKAQRLDYLARGVGLDIACSPRRHDWWSAGFVWAEVARLKHVQKASWGER